MCLMQTTTQSTISATTFGKTIPVQDLGWQSSVALCREYLPTEFPEDLNLHYFPAQYVASTGCKPSVTTMSLVMFPLRKMSYER